MTHVARDRRFVAWRDEEDNAIQRLKNPRLHADDMDWMELQKHHRVVILAEAGSGKTEELRAQARALDSQGSFAFYTTERRRVGTKYLQRRGHDSDICKGSYPHYPNIQVGQHIGRVAACVNARAGNCSSSWVTGALDAAVFARFGLVSVDAGDARLVDTDDFPH